MKNQLKKFLETLSTIKGRMAGVGDSLPPDAEIERGSVLAYGKRAIENCNREIGDTLNDLEKLLTEASELATEDGTISDEVREKVKQELLESGDLVTKADAQAATEAAVAGKETEIRDQLRKEADEKAELNARRDKLGEDIPKDVRGAIPEDALSGDQFEANSAKIAKRFQQLKELNISANSVLLEVASLKVDADGDAAYDKKVEQLKELMAGSGSTPRHRNPNPNFESKTDKPVVMI